MGRRGHEPLLTRGKGTEVRQKEEGSRPHRAPAAQLPSDANRDCQLVTNHRRQVTPTSHLPLDLGAGLHIDVGVSEFGNGEPFCRSAHVGSMLQEKFTPSIIHSPEQDAEKLDLFVTTGEAPCTGWCGG